jgi:hypothetical protein
MKIKSSNSSNTTANATNASNLTKREIPTLSKQDIQTAASWEDQMKEMNEMNNFNAEED